MKNTKWKILFLVHAANSETEDEVEKLFDNLMKARSSEDVAVLVFYSKRDDANINNIEKLLISNLYKYQYNKIENRIEKKLSSIPFGGTDSGDARTLKYNLKVIHTEFPSERTLLCTWAHGQGFGVFGEAKEPSPVKGRYSLASPLFFNELIKKAGDVQELQNEHNVHEVDKINRIFEDKRNGEKFKLPFNSLEEYNKFLKEHKEEIHVATTLTNDALAESIKDTFGKPKVDVLLMMNCNMQTIETGYALRESVDTLVAAETFFPWSGFNVIKIIKKISEAPDISNEDVARLSLATLEVKDKKRRDNMVVSAVKPGAVSDLKVTIDHLAAHLYLLMANKGKKITSLRKRIVDISRPSTYDKKIAKDDNVFDFIDILFFCSHLLIEDLIPRYLLQKIKTAQKKYVFAIKTGKAYLSKNSRTKIAMANGVSIFHPSSTEVFDLYWPYDWFYKNGKYQSTFAQDSIWKHFLIKYRDYLK